MTETLHIPGGHALHLGPISPVDRVDGIVVCGLCEWRATVRGDGDDDTRTVLTALLVDHILNEHATTASE